MKLYDDLEGPAWLQLVVDVDALTIEIGGMETGAHGPFPDWQSLTKAYPEIWAELIEPYGGPADFCDSDGEPAHPMDLDAALERETRREAQRADFDRSAWTAKLERARALLRAAMLPPDARDRVIPYYRDSVDLSPEALADGLQYVIELEERDGLPPIGGSKLGGLPDIPPEAEWPRVDGQGTALLLQVNLAELAAVDASGGAPSRGLFQVFATANGQAAVRFVPTLDGLERRHRPEPEGSEANRRVLDGWLENERAIRFQPGFYFGVTGDTGGPGAPHPALPEALIRAVSEALDGAEPSHGYSGNRIFGGDPVDWQAMGSSHLSEPLFCQLVFGEGHLSVGVHPVDLRSSFFADAVTGYCGT